MIGYTPSGVAAGGEERDVRWAEMTLPAVFIRQESIAGQDDEELVLTVVPFEVRSAAFPEHYVGEFVLGFPENSAARLGLAA